MQGGLSEKVFGENYLLDAGKMKLEPKEHVAQAGHGYF